MDRASWLRDRRAAVRDQYDTEAPEYDAFEYPVPLHAAFVQRLLATTAPKARILDAPCGTGKWFRPVTESGRRVVGADQSAGMLDQARSTGLAEELHHVGLQELAFEHEFDGGLTIDGMEHVPPEDWPGVVRNLFLALRPAAHLYLTVEESDERAVDEADKRQHSLGLPTVHGEVIEGDTGGYHYYPGREQAVGWLGGAGFAIVDEAVDWQDDWGYRHFLLRAG